MARAYGWNTDGSLNPDEAEHLRAVVKHLLDGGSLKSITKKMSDDGVPTLNGAKMWAPRTISRAVQNPRMAGLRRTKVRGENEDRYDTDPGVEPLISRADWVAVCDLFADESRKRFAAHRDSSGLLSGVARCCLCDGLMYYVSTAPARYQCPNRGRNCKGVSINAGMLDPEVEEQVLVKVSSRPWLRALDRVAAKPPNNYEQDIADADARIVTLAELFGGGDQTDETALQAGITAARAAKAEAQRKLELVATAANLPSTTPEEVVEWWVDVATKLDKRELILLLVDQARVYPRSGNPLIEDRVDITWKP